MTAKTDLLPCPFCGGTEIHIGPMDQPNAWDYWVVGCNNYDCQLDADSVKVELGTPEKAAAAWNTRATAANLAALQAENERLRAEVERLRTDGASAVRWAPSSSHWSAVLRELFGPNARDGIDATEARLREERERAERLAEALALRDRDKEGRND